MAEQSLSNRWARAVTSQWRWVLLTWLAATVVMRLIAPAWNDIAYDGDFEYLPAEMNSVAGGRLLDDAFLASAVAARSCWCLDAMTRRW